MIGREQRNEQHGGGQEPPSTLFGLSVSSLGSHSGELSRMGVTKSLRANSRAYFRESNIACQGTASSHSRPSSFIPNTVFPPGSTIATSASGLTCQRDEARQLLVCRGPEQMTVTVQMRVP
jgi:hypothetical protein